ncbi:unnamed protein product [Moneuplotes crassus]|uniref:Uncharacterized protein n=1 Tax=Euplotes crassus TaxID=5936 RepID=A0AAD2D5Q8_EUPCR|nr:unnamed protein product [Moneuplotes crassus]
MGQSNCFTVERKSLPNLSPQLAIDQNHTKSKPKKKKSANKSIRKLSILQVQNQQSSATKNLEEKTSDFSENLAREYRVARSITRKTLHRKLKSSNPKKRRKSNLLKKQKKELSKFMSPLVQEFVVYA